MPTYPDRRSGEGDEEAACDNKCFCHSSCLELRGSHPSSTRLASLQAGSLESIRPVIPELRFPRVRLDAFTDLVEVSDIVSSVIVATLRRSQIPSERLLRIGRNSLPFAE